MKNFPKFSLYACNIELNAYGRIYWGAFLGHKTITVSFYALKQALNFLCHEYTLFLSLWPQRRNFCPREKTFPCESSLITWGTIFNIFLLAQNFTYSWHKNWSVCFSVLNGTTYLETGRDGTGRPVFDGTVQIVPSRQIRDEISL